MHYYAQGIKYDTDEQEIPGLPVNMMVEADDIDQVVDKISDKTGWLVSSVGSISFIPSGEENPDQVHLQISTDLGFTASFLRELADAIENRDPFKDYETFRGVATITWPQ
jgi:hypothetical protein